jgi:hypothetical protein
MRIRYSVCQLYNEWYLINVSFYRMIFQFIRKLGQKSDEETIRGLLEQVEGVIIEVVATRTILLKWICLCETLLEATFPRQCPIKAPGTSRDIDH